MAVHWPLPTKNLGVAKLHEHKTYGINFRNPKRKYTHEAIKGVEYCMECNKLIKVTKTERVIDLD